MTDQPTQDIPGPMRPKSVGAPALRGFIGGLIGGVAVVLAGAGGVVAVWPELHDQLFSPETQHLADLDRALAETRPRLDALEHAPASAAAAASESGSPTAREATTDSLARLEAELENLRRSVPAEGTILRLVERAESAEKEVRDIAARRASAQALLMVVGQLRDAVDRGDSYEVELHAARQMAPADDAPPLDALTPTAPAGIPRRDRLIAQFPALRDKILHGDASEGTVWQKIAGKLSTMIVIRRIDGKGDGADAVVSRAEARLKDDNLADAARELSSLDGPAGQMAAPWVAAVTARVGADKALSELSALAISQTAKGGN